MNVSQSQLVRILSIGHDVSMRGAGLSLADALSRVEYLQTRGSWSAADLVPILSSCPEFLEQWMSYSEDKRTSGGWWVDRTTPTIGRVADPQSIVHFPTFEEAVAEYVVRELDFWSSAP